MPHLHLTGWGDWLPKPMVGTCYACDPEGEDGHPLVGDPCVHVAGVGERYVSLLVLDEPEVDAA